MSEPGATAAPSCYRHPGRETWIRCQRCERPICPDCMNSASVGFQCPDCVREGRRQTRSGLLRFGGKPSRDPRQTTIGLIVLNALVWVAILATGGNRSGLVNAFSLLPTGRCASPADAGYFPGATSALVCRSATPGHWIPGVADGSVWQLLTSAFTHVEVLHIGFNMLALYFLGPPLEMVLGRTRFLAVYLVSALAGSTAVMFFADPMSQTLGASGAIFGLMGALVAIGLRTGLDMRQIWFWIVLNLLFTFTASGISWEGHIGGLIGGAVTALILVYAPRPRRVPLQAAGIGGVVLILLVATAIRMAALG